MATIVHLSQYRPAREARQRESAPAEQAAQAGPHYFCTRCENDRFRLFATGAVHCASCGALMRNLGATELEKGSHDAG